MISISNLRRLYSGDVWKNVGDIYHGYGGLLGITQMENTKQSLQAQINYEQYLRQGNQRAYDDWMRNVGSKGRTIRYPELSYPGQIYRADTSIARAGLDYDTASANGYGNILFRAAGLYGIGSRVARTL